MTSTRNSTPSKGQICITQLDVFKQKPVPLIANVWSIGDIVYWRHRLLVLGTIGHLSTCWTQKGCSWKLYDILREYFKKKATSSCTCTTSRRCAGYCHRPKIRLRAPHFSVNPSKTTASAITKPLVLFSKVFSKMSILRASRLKVKTGRMFLHVLTKSCVWSMKARACARPRKPPW